MMKNKGIIVICLSIIIAVAIGLGIAQAAGTFDSDIAQDTGDYDSGIAQDTGDFDLNRHETWFDESGKNIVSMSDAEKIKEGMTFEQVVSIIGQPLRDVGSGAVVLVWNTESGKQLSITFNPSPGRKDPDNEGDLVAYVIYLK